MKIQYLRQKANISQKDFAEMLGIKNNTYNQYELGKRQADIQTYIKIANYFNVSLDYLLDNPQRTSRTSEFTLQEEELIDMFRDLSDLNKEIILRNFYILLGPEKRKNYDSLKYINL